MPSVLLFAAALLAQGLPLPFGTPTPVPSAAPVQTAPVLLDGRVLFVVAGVPSAATPLTAAVRAANIQQVISLMLGVSGSGGQARTNYDPATLRIRIEQSDGQTLLAAHDQRHPEPLPIVTVTSDDAAYQHVSVSALATRWQGVLEDALVHALAIRQPATIRRNSEQAAIAAAVLALLTAAGWWFLRRLRRRIEALRTAVAEHDRLLAAEESRAAAGSVDDGAADRQQRISAMLVRRLGPSQRLALAESARSVVVWALLLAWFAAAIWTLLLFPQTSSVGNTVLRHAIVIAGIWIVTGLLDRAIAVTIGRLPLLWELRRPPVTADRAREQLRMPTIVRALGGFSTTVLVFLALLATLTEIGIPVGSVVTIGGVAAIAVSLASQNIFRDFVGGFLVLAEDQYVVGDFVTINALSGIVERLTLRMVQIRDVSGSLVTISHSAATTVVNRSRSWSRVDYRISIDPAADVGAALEILRRTIEELRGEGDWREGFRTGEDWIGVDGFSRDGIILRALVRTGPMRQFRIERELNLRVCRALAAAKIGFGAPPPPPAI